MYYLSFQLFDAKQLIIERKNTPDVSEHYEKQIQNLRNELEVVRNRLQASEDKAEQPSPFLIKLQSEMAEVKVCCFILNLSHFLSQ